MGGGNMYFSEYNYDAERLRQRREALGWDTWKATQEVAQRLGVADCHLRAARRGEPMFLETSLLALENGTFYGDAGPATAAYSAALTAEEQRRADILHDNAAQLAEDRESEAAERMADLAKPARGWTRHSSGSYWCLHCNATGDAPGDQDCSNCGSLGWRGPVPTPEVVDVP